MAIETADLGVVLQGIGALAQGIAIFIAACFAKNTFEGWKKQQITERQMAQAVRVLSATHKARKGLYSLRSPAILADEMMAAEDELKAKGLWPEAEERQKTVKLAQVYYSRLEAKRDVIFELEDCQSMASALIGSDLEMAMDELNRQFFIVKIHVDLMLRLPDAGREEVQTEITDVLYRDVRTSVGHKNKMDETIALLVKKIEGFCQPILKADGK